jgi:chromate reductase
MAEFDAPSFNADIQSAAGLPAGALELQRRLAACDAFVICSPEYNASAGPEQHRSADLAVSI